MSINNRLINTGAALPPLCPDGADGVTLLGSRGFGVGGLFWHPTDGTRFWTRDANNINEYTATVPYSIVSGTTTFVKSAPNALNGQSEGRGVWFKPDGTRMYYGEGYNNTIKQWTLTTPWDISTQTNLVTFTTAFTSGLNLLGSVKFSDDGSKMLVKQLYGNVINVFPLSTPWDISSANSSNYTFHHPIWSQQDYAMTGDGFKLLHISDTIRLFSFPTPFVYAYAGSSWQTLIQNPSINGVYMAAFSPDYSKFYYNVGGGLFYEFQFNSCTVEE